MPTIVLRRRGSWRWPLIFTPSMRILPPSMGSSPLTQRRRVLLPDPLGPQITTTSARVTLRLTCFRTWFAPNHLSTRSISTKDVSAIVTADSTQSAVGSSVRHLPELGEAVSRLSV